MEVKIFLRLLLRKWWIIFSTMFIIVGCALVLTYTIEPVYSATATYIISPSRQVLRGTNFISGLSVLGGQPTVVNTYAGIAASTAVRLNALNALGLNADQTESLRVNSRVQSGTNIIEVSVDGDDPLLVRALANRIGQSTQEQMDRIYRVYDMKILDSAQTPGQPIWPDMYFNLVMGTALGLALGISIAFLSDLSDY